MKGRQEGQSQSTDMTKEAELKERERERDLKGLLLAVRMESHSQGMQAASRSWRGQGKTVSLERPGRTQPSHHLNFRTSDP